MIFFIFNYYYYYYFACANPPCLDSGGSIWVMNSGRAQLMVQERSGKAVCRNGLWVNSMVFCVSRPPEFQACLRGHRRQQERVEGTDVLVSYETVLAEKWARIWTEFRNLTVEDSEQGRTGQGHCPALVSPRGTKNTTRSKVQDQSLPAIPTVDSLGALREDIGSFQ